MFTIVQGTKLYEQVIEQIKSQILRGMYTSGDMLPSEKDLMTGMGVSRITVREALRLLAGAGIIETQHGKGSRVLVDGSNLTRRQNELFADYRERFLETTRARLVIEPELARYVASIASQADSERIKSAAGAPFPDAREGGAAEFHRAIVETTGNRYLVDFFGAIFDAETRPRGSTLVPPALREDVYSRFREQHRKIAEAIGEHNGEFAYFYMKEHTLFVEQMYRDYFDRSGEGGQP
ncbi:MAG: GntR family transcriptional regulator [Treponema sp.]|nr:GntR family transcriptional regulator [Treponema sp.]